MNMLERGEFQPGQQVPTEDELRKIFGVSRTTVRNALSHLLQKGLLERKQGKGTFWTASAFKLKKEKLTGINTQIFNVTQETRVRHVEKMMMTPAKEIAAFLKVPQGNQTVLFKRLRFIKNEPMSYTVNHLPEDIGGTIEPEHLKRMTMLETLEKVVGVELGRIEHEVEITRADKEISEKLAISVLDPVLTIQTSVFDKHGRPIEIVWTHFVENRYKFRVVFDK